MEYEITGSKKLIKNSIDALDKLVSIYGNPSQAVLFSYIAGIIDGEGSIRLQKNKLKENWNYSYHLQLCCGMVTKEIPDLLCATLGGTVREERVVDSRSIWRWTLTGRYQIYAVLKILQPFLRVKKEHAKVAMEFCEKWKNPKRNHRLWVVDNQQISMREDAYQKIHKLNAVGKQAQRLNELACESMKR
jgi:hypothetical protein